MTKQKASKNGSTSSYEGVVKMAVDTFRDLLRKGRKVIIPTESDQFKLEGVLFLRSLEAAQEFVNCTAIVKPRLRMEHVFSVHITKYHLPPSDVLFGHEALSDVIGDIVASYLEELDKQFPMPEDETKCHPMLNDILVALDAVVMLEGKMPKGKQKVTSFLVKDNEQIIVTTTSTTTYS